jgi:hypothetical protein
MRYDDIRSETVPKSVVHQGQILRFKPSNKLASQPARASGAGGLAAALPPSATRPSVYSRAGKILSFPRQPAIAACLLPPPLRSRGWGRECRGGSPSAS